MSSLGAALNSALRSLEANQLALAVASNNISNAQTPGYTRQRAILTPASVGGDQYRIGGGVQIIGTEAIRERMIDVRIRQEVSSRSKEDTMHAGLSDVEMLFNDSEDSGMMAALSDFFNSFHDLSKETQSSNARVNVISTATRLAGFLNSRAGALSDFQTHLDGALREDVAQANSLVDQIAAVSRRIAEEETIQPAHELRDQRTSLVQRLSEIIEIHELESSGEYQLTTANNQPLVYNGVATHLEAVNNTSGRVSIHIGIDDITDAIQEGRIGARLDLRDNTIPSYVSLLDQLAYGLAQEVNAVHSTAYDANGNVGNNFFTPLTALAGAARNIAVDPALATDPTRIATSRQANGTGNEAAIELGNLIHANVFPSGSIVEHYRGLIYSVGSDTAAADSASRQHEALLNQLQNRRQEVSGVSIDEETVNILRFQRSFEASARVVKAVDELLQLTLSMVQ